MKTLKTILEFGQYALDELDETGRLLVQRAIEATAHSYAPYSDFHVVVPYFPFLTAAVDKADTIAMLQEMATAGVGMAVLVTAVWGGMVAVSHMLEKREQKEQEKAEE